MACGHIHPRQVVQLGATTVVMGGSTERLVRYVERINKADAKGNRLVRIHAVGFPQTYLAAQQVTPSAIAFANLMRQLTWRNGGTFVGLNDYR